MFHVGTRTYVAKPHRSQSNAELRFKTSPGGTKGSDKAESLPSVSSTTTAKEDGGRVVEDIRRVRTLFRHTGYCSSPINHWLYFLNPGPIGIGCRLQRNRCAGDATIVISGWGRKTHCRRPGQNLQNSVHLSLAFRERWNNHRNHAKLDRLPDVSFSLYFWANFFSFQLHISLTFILSLFGYLQKIFPRLTLDNLWSIPGSLPRFWVVFG